MTSSYGCVISPSLAKRIQTLKLLAGPAMEVKVTSEDGKSRIWSLSKALLSYHSSYFKRMCRSDIFIEGQDNKVELQDFEPDTFDMFVEFMYYGRYTHYDDTEDDLCVRPSAKAWVLGDYLDAVKFKDFAMHYLHDLYMPAGDDDDNSPMVGIGPDMVSYCCSRTAPKSRLYRLVKAFLIQNWHDHRVIQFNYTNRDEWDDIWANHPELVSDLLFLTQQEKSGRVMHEPEIEHYLEAGVVDYEPVVPAASTTSATYAGSTTSADPAAPPAPTAPTTSAAPAATAAPAVSSD